MEPRLQVNGIKSGDMPEAEQLSNITRRGNVCVQITLKNLLARKLKLLYSTDLFFLPQSMVLSLKLQM